ncbi:hypothetical protein NLZ15_13155 [Atlantibacter subterranea]|uniref:hypothetical protein n=1 Tax=Atlantibacter subterraneus TaxID=255519 RepID=UPI0020C49587|nr:hypothetical protein [Atlantibacter subterranea]UTJ45807.1 hypothetical protein NLZ15_13155 [Atlantibacter subterranea]
MGWERQKSTVADLPEEPSLILWLIAGIVALVTGLLLFVLHANQLLGILQQYNLWVVAAGPLSVWFVFICLRGWRYNNVFDKHQFESDEADYAQQQWTAWAGRHIAVLHGGVILPRGLSPATLLQAPSELEQVINQAVRINIQENKKWLTLLINSVRYAVEQLPADLPLNVTLITDSQSEELSLQTTFSEVWQKNISSGRLSPVVSILKSKSFIFLDERLKSPILDVDLILVHQMQGRDKYSDALAALLLTSDDVATKYQLSHHARLLRPMSLESTQMLSEELDTFFSTQSQAIAARAIVGDSIEWGDDFPTLLTSAKQYEGSWKLQQCHWLEKYAGLSGPFSPWIMAAVVSDIAMLTKEDCLMLSGDKEQRFVNTVTTGNLMNGEG